MIWNRARWQFTHPIRTPLCSLVSTRGWSGTEPGDNPLVQSGHLLVLKAGRRANPEQYAGTIHASNPEYLLVFKAPGGNNPEQKVGTINTSNREHLLGERERWPMRGLETDHAISEPTRGLKLDVTFEGNHKHTDIATLSLTWPRGPSQCKHI
jgi:hypothetical protein